MMIRPALLDDTDTLVRLHAQAWRETYPGLLPEDEIARMTAPDRLATRWQANLARGDLRIAYAPDLGFAVMGPQREAAHKTDYPEELWAIYLIRAGQHRGLGQALLTRVAAKEAFTARVVEGNDPACRFYAARGGQVIDRQPEQIGISDIIELTFGWQTGALHC